MQRDMTPTHRALHALYAAASRIPEGVAPPPDRYGPLCAALKLAEPLVSEEDSDAALAELLAEHEASDDPAYREAMQAGKRKRPGEAWRDGVRK